LFLRLSPRPVIRLVVWYLFLCSMIQITPDDWNGSLVGVGLAIGFAIATGLYIAT